MSKPWASSSTSFAVFMLHACVSILASVTVSGTAPFLLSEKAGVAVEELPQRIAQMVLADELLAICASVGYGHLLDNFGLTVVCALAHAITGAGLLSLALFSSSFMQALFSRLLFASGFAGLMVCLVAGLSSLSVARSEPKASSEPAESSGLLGPRKKIESSRRSSAGLLGGLINMPTALGAVLAALGLNRLPPVIGVSQTYMLVAAIEFFVAFLVVALLRAPRALRPAEGSIFRGFRLLLRDSQVALACAVSFASRAQTVLISTFLPALVADFWIRSGLCRSTDSELPPEYLKRGCRAAYGLSSTLTGSSQLMSLLLAPAIGFALHKLRPRPPFYVLIGYTLGAIGFLLIFALPHGDPRVLSQSMLGVLLVGQSQAAGMVCSLALVGDARLKYTASLGSEEIAGAISSVYAIFGSLGILIVTQGGGLMARYSGPASVFALQAAVFCLVAVFAAIVVLRSRSTRAVDV